MKLRGGFSFKVDAISLIMQTKNKPSTETEHVKSSESSAVSVYCVPLIEKGAVLSSTPAAAARSAKQQPQYFADILLSDCSQLTLHF